MATQLPPSRFAPGTIGFYGLIGGAVAVLYAVALMLSSPYSGPGKFLGDLSANIFSLLACALLARPIIARYVFPLAALPQAIAHMAAAFAFSVVWFFLLMVFLGMANGQGLMTFSVRPFLGPVAAWQLIQGASFYALVALLTYLERNHARLETAEPETAKPDDPTGRRLFVRDGDEMRPLDPARVVQVTGAGDYAEVVTVSGKHLIRTSLNELEASLGDNFLRVHRSHIVNIDRIERMEPAGGGRMSLHLANGESIVASRTGAKALRDRAV